MNFVMNDVAKDLVQDIIRKGLLAKTENGSLKWHYSNEQFTLMHGPIKATMFDNRGLCDVCGEEFGSCDCGSPEGVVILILESAHEPLPYGFHSEWRSDNWPVITELADSLKKNYTGLDRFTSPKIRNALEAIQLFLLPEECTR